MKHLRASATAVQHGMAVATMIATVIATLACLCAWSPLAYAKETGEIVAPDNATQVWVDVEYVADDVTIQGTWNEESLGFQSSPSGMTAIAKATAGTEYTLALSASEQIETAYVAVTFADANNVILQQSASTTAIDKQETPVIPENPTTPNDPDDDGGSGNGVGQSDSTGSTDAGGDETGVFNLSKTGSQIVAVIAVAVLLCAIGSTLMVLRNRRRPAHAASRGGDSGLNDKEETR